MAGFDGVETRLKFLPLAADTDMQNFVPTHLYVLINWEWLIKRVLVPDKGFLGVVRHKLGPETILG